jgi:hypothetical protein
VQDAARCARLVLALTLQHMAVAVAAGAVLLMQSALPEVVGGGSGRCRSKRKIVFGRSAVCRMSRIFRTQSKVGQRATSKHTQRRSGRLEMTRKISASWSSRASARPAELGAGSGASPVDLPEHDIKRADYRRDVC